jgi:hypothetical protein
MEKKKKHKARSIITGHLEKIGSNVFDNYSSVITELIKGNQGIYALYKKDRLYYVGLASNLKSRINAHNKDKHQNKWTHFSLYIIRKEDHIKEIESLVLRISYPKGNSVRGKLKQSKDLRPLLKRKIKGEQIKQLGGFFGSKNRPAGKTKKRMNNKNGERPLRGYFPEGKVIYASYRGKEYKAWANTNGSIKCAGRSYNSPSLAGIAVTKKKTINGWKFWKYKNKDGDLVYIDALRK